MNGAPGGGLVVRVVHGPDVGLSAVVDGPMVVGRGIDPLPLNDARVSRRHLQLDRHQNGLLVSDLQSAGGTTIRGRAAAPGTVVAPGDTIEIGATVLRVLRVATGVSTESRSDFVFLDVRGVAQPLPLRSDALSIGRDGSSDVVIDAPSISRRHALLRRDGSSWVVTDERSSNGTFVNGQRIVGSRPLSRGDELTFGTSDVRLVYAPTSTGGDVRVRLGEEADPRRYAVTISAPGDATVADVMAQCVQYLSLPPDDTYVLIRSGAGLILSPALRWVDCGVVDGEELVVGVGEIPEGAAAVAVSPKPSREAFNQLPRAVHRPAPYSVRAPDPPDSTKLRGRGLLWQVIGGLVAICGGLALAILRPSYLIFGVIMGVAGLSSVVVSIASEQARRRRRMDDFQQRVASLDRELDDVCRSQAETLRVVAPDDAALTSIVADRSRRLWERRLDHPDALMLRIGTGQTAAAITVERNSFHQFGRHEGREVDDAIERHRTLVDVPVCLPGLGAELVGIVGRRELAHDAVARAIIEAAALHPPDQVRIWILSDGPAWDWCRWLPHVADDTRCSLARSAEESNAIALELLDELEQLPKSTARQPPPIAHLVIVLHDTLRLTNVVSVLRAGMKGCGQIIAVADDARDLPTGVATLFSIGDDGTGSLEGQHPDPPLGRFSVQGTPLTLSARLAREFASITLARSAQQSGSSGLVELATGTALGDLDVGAAWSSRRNAVAGPIGLGDDGAPIVLDFRRDGPHGMIAGTTGSGKSELLQTLLASLVLTHDPTVLNLFLIDFKGGATFSPLAVLPHVVGVVTDLENDSDLATRAFTALDAEIERRKRLLDRANVPNIIDYERLTEAAAHPLPSLLVVIDEFALLMKQQPELKDRLDTVATQGRSLGVHLLLATQSPSGVVTNAIRTNTNLWICLRVVSDAESSELLGRRDAARIPTGRAGRGYIRKGAADSIVGFQAARIARDLDQGSTSVVEIRPFIDARPSTQRSAPVAPARGRRITELDVTVQKIVETFTRSGLPPATSLWTAPLPTELPSSDVPPFDEPDGHLVAVLGTIDIPQQQRTVAATIDFTAAGHGLILGVLGSGRTTALRQLAIDLAERHSPADVHIYAIDAGAGSLADLAQLPHTAGVIAASDDERVIRLMSRLHREMETRRARLTLDGAGNYAQWRRAQPTPPPSLVVVIDDYATLRQSIEQIENGRLVDLWNALIGGGPAVGIHLMMAIAQTGDLRVSHVNLVGNRVVLRASDSTDFQLIETRVKADQFSKWPPGRGMVAGGHLMQVAMPTPERVAAIRATWAGVAPRLLPRPVERLPKEVDYLDIEVPADLPRGALVVGLGGDDCEAVAVDLQRGNGLLLVIGPNQSGRTTLLCSLMTSVLAREPDTRFGIIGMRDNQLRQMADHPRVEFVATTPSDASAALTALATRTGPPLVVLVDDAELLPSNSPDPLDAALRRAPESGIRFVVAARTTDLQSLYEPWARYVQTQRFAIALQPGPDESYLLGVRALSNQGVPQGRGVVCERGATTPVQVHRTDPRFFSAL